MPIQFNTPINTLQANRFRFPRTYSAYLKLKKAAINTKEKIKNFVVPIFQAFIQTVTFPLRYLGSKSWSLPGLLFSAPYKLYKKLPFFENTGYSKNFKKHLTSPNHLMPYYKYLTASALSHDNDQKWISGLNLNLHSFVGAQIDVKSISAHTEQHQFSIMDPHTGLKVQIVENDEEAIISFGASGSCHCDIDDENVQKWLNITQKVTTLGNFIGYTPKIFEQACRAVDALSNAGCLTGKKVSLTGQNFGGTLAAYVALKKQLPAVCFNTIPFGVGVQYHLGNDLLSQADKYVTHLIAKNEILSDPRFTSIPDQVMGLIGLRTPGNFGQRFSFPSAYSNIIETHSYVMGSFRKILGFKSINTKTTEPENLVSEITNKFKECGLTRNVPLMNAIKTVFENLQKAEKETNVLTKFNLFNSATNIDLAYLYACLSYMKHRYIGHTLSKNKFLEAELLAIEQMILHKIEANPKLKPFFLSTFQRAEFKELIKYPNDLERIINAIQLIEDHSQICYRYGVKNAEHPFRLSNAKFLPTDKKNGIKEKNIALHASLETSLEKINTNQLTAHSEARFITPFYQFLHNLKSTPKFVGFISHEYKEHIVKSAVYKVATNKTNTNKGYYQLLIVPHPNYGKLFDVEEANIHDDNAYSRAEDRHLYFSSAVAAFSSTYHGGKESNESFTTLTIHQPQLAAALDHLIHFNAMRKEINQEEMHFEEAYKPLINL